MLHISCQKYVVLSITEAMSVKTAAMGVKMIVHVWYSSVNLQDPEVRTDQIDIMKGGILEICTFAIFKPFIVTLISLIFSVCGILG